MSDPIRHECGIAVVRLKKPLAYFQEARGGALFGFNLLAALMMKQRNRGQDGVGIGCCKLDMPPGAPYMFRERADTSVEQMAEVFDGIRKDFKRIARRVDEQRKQERDETGAEHPPFEQDPESIKREFELAGEINIGHLRYGTSGSFGRASLHPYLRRSTWPTRSLMVMGNFNLTNTAELNRVMMQRGQHPVFGTDTQTVLEEIGFQLDEAHTDLYHKLRDQGLRGEEIPPVISQGLDVTDVIRKSSHQWDGGYTIVGVIGNGDLFVMRDPNGIRPCYYIHTEEVLAFASERVALMSVLELEESEVYEVPPGHVAVMKACGKFTIERFTAQSEYSYTPCSFERIYFSRGNDSSIYKQRKKLGECLVPQVIEAIDNDFKHTVLSFIPNTAETAYFGFLDGLRYKRRQAVREALAEMIRNGETDNEDKLDDLILHNWPRAEKIALKDIKMRTFIAQESGRNDLVSSVYDITYGVVTPEDNLVVIDDSIVRGTTLKTSLLRILARTNPKRIIILSTAPQIRYPDCYGIDMAELGKFIAFEAATKLLTQRGMRQVLRDTYQACREELAKPRDQMRNAVKAIYAPFTNEEISAKIAELVTPPNSPLKGRIQVIFQTIPNLHAALGAEFGDWYFSGDYPTPGGFAVVNQSYINHFQGREGRAYDTLL